MSGPDKEGLDRAYAAFVEEIVEETSSVRRLQKSHRRHLAVSFNPDTATVHLLEDIPCPTTAADGAKCQTVYGRVSADVLFDLVSVK